MNLPTAVRIENEYLAQELGRVEGHPRYQWAWSEDLTMPIVLLDDITSEIVFDYHCRCGINVSVHSANCNFTAPRPRWEVRKLAPLLVNQWVFAVWNPPEASREDWESVFGGRPYPAQGYRVPVGDPQKCLALMPDQVPTRQSSQLMIAAVRMHFSKTGTQRNREMLDVQEARSEAWRARLRQAIKDVAPVHSGYPGKKEDWSFGGDPNVESPNLRSKLVLP